MARKSDTRMPRLCRVKIVAFDNLLREIRADIATIVMQMDAIRSGMASEINELQYKWLSKPMSDGRRVITTIDDYRDLLRMEEGTYETNRCDTDLFALFNTFVAEMVEIGRERRVKFVLEPKGIQITGHLDGELLLRVLRRIGHAVIDCAKPMDEVKGTVAIVNHGKDLVVEILAPGNELPKDMLETVLDPFGQAKVGLKLGRGYSMLFARTALKLMGGELRIVPWLGRGTRICLKVDTGIRGGGHGEKTENTRC